MTLPLTDEEDANDCSVVIGKMKRCCIGEVGVSEIVSTGGKNSTTLYNLIAKRNFAKELSSM